MPNEESIQPLRAALGDLLDWFDKSLVKGLIIGGVAASLLGRPRTTQDIDALVLLDQTEWKKFLEMGKTFGFFPRMADALDFAHKNRVLLMRHAPGNINIDISFGTLPFEEETMKRAIKVRAGTLSIPLPTPEDLVIMKAIARRPRDMADIEAILMANPEIDLKRVRHWVREFAKVLELPNIYNDLENILKKISPTSRKKSKKRGKVIRTI